MTKMSLKIVEWVKPMSLMWRKAWIGESVFILNFRFNRNKRQSWKNVKPSKIRGLVSVRGVGDNDLKAQMKAISERKFIINEWIWCPSSKLFVQWILNIFNFLHNVWVWVCVKKSWNKDRKTNEATAQKKIKQ